MTKRLDPDRIMSSHRGRDLFPDFRWTAENTARLKRLCGDGDSAGQIGAKLGCSRNAVIGKMGRIGLKTQNLPNQGRTGGDRDGGTIVRVKAKRSRIASAHNGGVTQRINNRASGSDAPIEPHQVSSSLAEFNASISKDQRKTLFELENNSCRFPINDGPDYLFCGAPGADMACKAPYCGFHSRAAGSGYTRERGYGRSVNNFR